MNLAEHPLAIDLSKRLATAKEKEGESIPVQAIFPVIGQMLGALRASEIPGLFILASNMKIESNRGPAKEGVMDFSFTADQVIGIIHPNIDDMENPKTPRIVP